MKRKRRGSRGRIVEALESRLLLAGEVAQNVRQPLDVNDDDVVAPMDALVCINEINREPRDPPGETSGRDYYYDVDGDGLLTPSDILAVVNKLNRGTSAMDPAALPPRSIDGTQNNLEIHNWGAAGTPLLRMTTASYGDSMSSPAGGDRPSARLVSNALAAQSAPQENDRNLSDMVWQWGQFLDHDISLTPSAYPVEPMPIGVPAGDPHFDPANDGDRVIDLSRSVYDTSPTAAERPRDQLNLITSFIDGSNVYGSDSERAAALRSFVGGELKMGEHGLLPFNEDGLPNEGGSGRHLFLAGDVRANEQVGLIAMHTLFVREHNRLAREISAAEPDLSDEEIYQRARAVVIAELQAITYNEFLPALLGAGTLSEYTGYDDTVNPGISNLFSTAAYRFGHSMLSPQLLCLDEEGNAIDEGGIPLRDAFFAPQQVVQQGIEPLLRGLAEQSAQEIDVRLIDDVRNFLFGPPGSGGFDLAALNIQRGRDHGLPSYNQSRQDVGLPPVTSFADITADHELQQALGDAYEGDIASIDVWVGVLAEDHVAGSSVGPLASVVLVDQFHRLRAGDQYWYQRMYSGETLQQLEQTTLAQVIQRNTQSVAVQSNVFLVSSV